MNTTSYDKAMRTLEFDKITASLAEYAPTEGARALALCLTPSEDPYVIRRRLSQTTAAKELIMAKGFPSFGGIRDITEAVARADAAMAERDAEKARADTAVEKLRQTARKMKAKGFSKKDIADLTGLSAAEIAAM